MYSCWIFFYIKKTYPWPFVDLPGLLWRWCRYRRFLIWLTTVLRRKIIPKQRITPVMAKNTGSSISAELGLVVTGRQIRVVKKIIILVFWDILHNSNYILQSTKLTCPWDFTVIVKKLKTGKVNRKNLANSDVLKTQKQDVLSSKWWYNLTDG